MTYDSIWVLAFLTTLVQTAMIGAIFFPAAWKGDAWNAAFSLPLLILNVTFTVSWFI